METVTKSEKLFNSPWRENHALKPRIKSLTARSNSNPKTSE